MPANHNSAPGRRPTPQAVRAARQVLGSHPFYDAAAWTTLRLDRAHRHGRTVLQLITTHEGGAA